MPEDETPPVKKLKLNHWEDLQSPVVAPAPPVADEMAFAAFAADRTNQILSLLAVKGEHYSDGSRQEDAWANYAEMAALIAPRPFMVERGHHDGVGTDEWVSYEYAKVRRLYAKLGISERTEIEFFDAGHTIHGVGTFEFLRKNLMQK